MSRRVRPILVLALLVALAPLSPAPASPATTPASSVKPPWWPERHASKVAEAKKGNVDLIFIGDSITQGYEGAGRDVWTNYYAPRKAMNLGFNRDKTENVLWRLDNGEIDGISPRLAVLLIGTNNTGLRRDKPEDIAEGVKAICDRLQAKLPETKILVLAILPRSPNPTDWDRANNEEANKLIARLADDQKVFFVNVNDKLTNPDGTLSGEIMPDMLHPSPKGYQIIAEAIEPTVARLMGDSPRK